MPLYDDFADARALAPESKNLIQLARRIQHHVGTSATLITRPGNESLLTLRCESGTIRYRPGDYRGIQFTVINTDQVGDTLALTAHGYETGQGPLQMTVGEATLTPGVSIVIDGPGKTFTRPDGNFFLDGFRAGQTITVANSSDNDGTFTLSAVAALVMTMTEAVVSEDAQTDLDITAPGAFLTNFDPLTDYWIINVDANTVALATSLANALAGTRVDFTTATGSGLMNVFGPDGWAPTAVASLNAGSYGSNALVAGEQIVIPAPDFLTVVGFSATDALTYWFSR